VVGNTVSSHAAEVEPNQDMISIALTVNGKHVSATLPAETTLLRFLRDELRLTGPKNGCSTNHCGACTVLVNGKATKSCLLQMRRLQGADIVTIEGLSAPGVLHPIQAAFLAAGAVQCGFCTPGMIIAAKALLDANPDPSEGEIRQALKDNVCRCTGYLKIIDAVRLAARWLKHPEQMKVISEGGYGESVIDLDGVAKVQGSLLFADDLYLPDMLQAKVLWSAHPHALIWGIDTAAAEQIPGVLRVLTARDVPGHNGFGPLLQDQPVLCGDRVRFVGDAVAMVVAEDEGVAAQARDLIQVEYEPLLGVFSPTQGLQEDAPELHPQGNVCKHLRHEVGDVEEGLAQSHLVVEGRFETPFVEHAYLEPESGLAYWDGGILNLRVPTQFPFELRMQLAKVLAVPEETIRVQTTPLGGSFGSKIDATVEPLIALGAYVTGRPVKLTLTREESLKRSVKRHASVLDYRVGLDEEGKLVAVDAKLVFDTGAYTNLGPRVIDQACMFACGPYEVTNLRVEGWAVHTNNVNASAFRGFGINQAAIAIESLLDEAARRLNLDPFELRYKNALREGSTTAAGEILRRSVAIQETIAAAREALEQELPQIKKMVAPGKRLGIGVASGFKNVGAGKGKVDDAGAVFTLLPGGKVQLRASAVDMGQGIRTTLAQVARQVLLLPDNTLELLTGDTTLTPQHGGAVAERQTLISGNAVLEAAKRFKTELLSGAAEVIAEPAEELELLPEGVVHLRRENHVSLEELESKLRERGKEVTAECIYVAPQTFALADVEGRKSVPPEEYRNYPAYAYTTQVAAVEVDPDSGVVRLLKVLAAHDVGRAINPQKIEGQIEGSCHMAQGYALSEEYPLSQGIPVARTYRDLHVPTIADACPVRTLVVEKPDSAGPLGAKGISEVATVPLTPAILNSIFDAVGVRIRKLPAKPDVIKNELERQSLSEGAVVQVGAGCL
jgi:CO/xanthine dehydrogenase Mo-binding subunit/aerobic-type carbon monoxide dehydrogenase small subunit (CoxS/CutS family)